MHIRVLTLLMAILISGCAHTGNKSYCIHSRGNLCRIPFDYLIFKDDLIRKAHEISVGGFFQREEDGFYLYRSQEEAKRRDRVFSLFVINADEFGELSTAVDQNYVGITGLLAPSNGDNWAVIRILRAPHQRADYLPEPQL